MIVVRGQSTLEFLVLLIGVVLIAIIISLYFYKGASSLNNSLVNLTNSQFNIFGINLYSSISGNYIYGYYYQTGNHTYNNATLGIIIKNDSYFIPISTTYRISTVGNYVFYFKSYNTPSNAIIALNGGNTEYM